MSYKNIKIIINRRFEIRLIQTDAGSYRVAWDMTPAPGEDESKPVISEPMLDYKTASIFFERKLLELEGH